MKSLPPNDAHLPRHQPVCHLNSLTAITGVPPLDADLSQATAQLCEDSILIEPEMSYTYCY